MIISTPPRALVLGATGFVGRHICTAMRADGFETGEVARRRPDMPPEGPFTTLDLGTAAPETIGELIDSYRPDVVVNTVGSIWGRSDEQMWSAAAEPVRRLIAALGGCTHRPWLVHLGSVLEYGPIVEGQQAGADHSLARPASAYGEAKLAATEAVLDAVAAGTVDAVVLRIANVTGPGTPAVSLLGIVAQRLLAAADSDTPPEITLDALVAHRDYVDVRDVAAAVVAAARVRRPGAVFDIGRGAAISVRELVTMLIAVSGSGARLVERARTPDPAASNWTKVDIEPARLELGWRPEVSLRESVEAFWDEIRTTRATALPGHAHTG
ncbi:NAD-dependent epimerase/dehydratase family protein [Nocardia sp. 004]|uniref:NAD-dependent epimerase/dehydratase family protein n=1 Tax=Nocardia sp. 004 TaxID=3385978 RepID=UPI00399EEB20